MSREDPSAEETEVQTREVAASFDAAFNFDDHGILRNRVRRDRPSIGIPHSMSSNEDRRKYTDYTLKRSTPRLRLHDPLRLVPQLERDVTVSQAQASPLVHRLPFEVLGNIFTEYVMVDKNDECVCYSRPLRVSSVCVAWRNVALRTPTVWSRIIVNVHDPYDPSRTSRATKMEYARLCVERSGVTPLYLSIHWEKTFMEFIDTLFDRGDDEREEFWAQWIVSLNRRVAYFHLKGPSGEFEGYISRALLAAIFRTPFPRLEELVLSGNVQSLGNSPFHFLQDIIDDVTLNNLSRLRNVTLQGGACAHEWVCVVEGLACLESLSINTWNQSISIISTLVVWLPLSTQASLQHLHIDGPSDYCQGSAPDHVIALPNLTTLHICGSLDMFPVFHQIFSVPALITLHIEANIRMDDVWGPECGRDTLTDFLEKSHFPSLRSFLLKSITAIDDSILKFVRTHPGLTSLIFHNTSVSTTMTALSEYPRFEGYGALCPRLARLEMQFITNKDAWAILARITKTRYRDAQADSHSELTTKIRPLDSLLWDGKDILAKERRRAVVAN